MANRAAGNPRPGDLPQEDIRLGRIPGWEQTTVAKWLADRPRLSTQPAEWVSHPGLLGLLDQLDISVDRVLPSPRIRIGIERDPIKGARAVAHYEFRVFGRYPGGTVLPISEGRAEITEFNEIRKGDWQLP